MIYICLFNRFVILGSIVLLLSVSSAWAVVVVDTGAGGAAPAGVALKLPQWLAGKFTLSDDYSITSVEGWLGQTQLGTVTSSIYNDSGFGTPIVGAALFSQQFQLDAPSLSVNTWDGAFGLDWKLAAGTYWLAFEVRPGDTGEGFMPDYSVPKPLMNYALSQNLGSSWFIAPPDIAWGIRISAASPVSNVPVPAAVWLFGTALIGFIGVSRRRKVA